MTKNKKLEGVYPALVTPFKEDETIDEEELRALVDRVIEGGVNGVIPSGSTGEFAFLSEKERESVIKIVIDQVNGRVPVVVGGMAPSTKETIRWSKFAEDLGADGLMIVNPYYGPQTNEALYQHFKTVAESVSIPIMPYNNTAASGTDLVPDVVIRLVKEGKISYLKECVDSRRMQIIKAACGDKINIFTGVDDLMFQCFTMGGVGCVSGGANAIPRVVKRLFNLVVKEKDFEAGRKLWLKYVPLARLLEDSEEWLPNLKALCEVVGHPVGKCRRPYLPVSQERKREIRKIVDSFGLL